MKFLQKLGKALMLPVACLPICGILMGIGYALCPATMQGGDITGIGNQIGFFLVKAGGALIDNMALLFVIGVGVGMADKHDGTGGLAALASWLMITNLLSTAVVTTIMPSIAKNADATLAFDKISNPFIGILAGVIGSMCYNKFKDTKLPDWLSFFSGKRCVAIIAGVVSIIVSVVLLFVWPVVFTALITVGQSIAKMGAVGAGIYAFLNRLLIPTGLHHALNNVFWFDTIGLGICYDLRFPELARYEALSGAQIMLYPAAWVKGEGKFMQWETLLRARAIENEMYVLGCCHYSKEHYMGRSTGFAPDGTRLYLGEEKEELLYAQIDKEQIQNIRTANPVFENRRKDLYD